MSQLIIIENIFEPEEKERIEFEGPITPILQERYETFPATGRLFLHSICDENCLGLGPNTTQEQIELLDSMEGDFYLVLQPRWPVVYIIIMIIAIAIAFLMKPKIPNLAQRNTQQSSPNNDLAQRTNMPRLGARIPDIMGVVRSTPDMLAVPYSIYDDNVEHEIAMLCIGRGHVEVYDAKDGPTNLNQIEGAIVEVFDPDTNIWSGSPQSVTSFNIGGRIRPEWPPIYPQKSNAVNGQTLRAPNFMTMRGDKDMFPMTEGSFNFFPLGSQDRDFSKVFQVGDVVNVYGAVKLFNPIDKTIIMNPTYGGAFWFPGSSIPADWEVGSLCQIVSGNFTVWEQKITGTQPNPAYPGPDPLNPTEPETIPIYTRVVSRVVDISGLYAISNIVVQNMGGSAGMGVMVYLENPLAVNPQWQYLVYPSDIEGGTRKVILSRDGVEYNLDGQYTVQTVSKAKLYFANAPAVNPDWAKVGATQWEPGSALSPTITVDGTATWVGPFVVDMKDGNEILNNFVALNGLYKDNGKKQIGVDVTIELEYTKVDQFGNAEGVPISRVFTIYGSAVDTGMRAISVSDPLDPPGRWSVRAQRISDTDTQFEGTVVDEIKWKDLYHFYHQVSDDELKFPHVTVVRTQQKATTGALAQKERKLNMRVCRRIPIYDFNTGTFGSSLVATDQFEYILAWCIYDKYIGNLDPKYIDGPQIKQTGIDIRNYFNVSIPSSNYPDNAFWAPTAFGYTFDKENMTVEETLQAIAGACFSICYRSADKIRLNFLKQTANATMLFNHRNKLPGSEKRTIRFGRENNYDGIELSYVNPEDDSITKLVWPEDSPQQNLKKVETVGVRNTPQAQLHLRREWNIVKYQYASVEFESISHGELLMLNDPILIADNTNGKTQDGEVMAMSGFDITTSQEVSMPGSGYTIFLQLSDKTVQSMPCSYIGPNTVRLSQAPRLPLVTDITMYSRTGYNIVRNTDNTPKMFLVNEASPGQSNTIKVTATNYDDRLFDGDGQFRP
jgi:hypothetical protein